MKVTAVTCVKNEGPFLLEWIAFNRLIGVTDFLFYSNDCTDGTDDLLDALAARGLVHHLPNPAKGRSMQVEALNHARDQDVVRGADWIWIADVDEFLNIHAGAHRLEDLISACEDPAAISITFQFFANGGVDAFEDAPVIAQFTRCHNPDIWCGETAIEVKTLTRADTPVRRFGAHRPFLKKGLARLPRWTDGAGRRVPPRFAHGEHKRRLHKFPARGARRFATLNHYALRSLDSYLVKNDRGDVNREHRAFDDGYWRDRNDAAWEDRSIQRYLPELEAALAELKSDPEISRLHDTCAARHSARRDALLQDPHYAALQTHLRALPTIPAAEYDLMQKLGLVA